MNRLLAGGVIMTATALAATALMNFVSHRDTEAQRDEGGASRLRNSELTQRHRDTEEKS